MGVGLALLASSLVGVVVLAGAAGPASAVVDIGNLGPRDVPVCPGGVYPEPLFTPNCRLAAESGPITSASHDLVNGQSFAVEASGVDAVPCFRAPASAPLCSSARLQNIRFYNPNAPLAAHSSSVTNPWEHIALDFSPTSHGFSDCLDGCTGTARYFSVDANLPGECKGKPAAECTLPQVFFGPVLMIVQWDVMILSSSGQAVQRWTWEEVFRISSGISTPTQNQPPHASFTWRVSDDDPLTLSFDGSGSTDDTGVAGYDWTIEGKTATGAQPPPYTFSGPGTYPVQLTVRDTEGLTDSVTLDVKVATGIVVNSTADTADESPGDGACHTGGTIDRGGTQEPECTLRAAIQEAGTQAGADAIRFDIPGGPPTILPQSPLPDVANNVTIDGTTQPGGWVGLAGNGDDSGLTLTGTGNSVRGLAFTGLARGVTLAGTGQTVAGNRFGIGVTGEDSLPNDVAIVADGATGARIGGVASAPGTAPGNVVVGGVGDTVGVLVAGGDDVRVEGNLIRDVVVGIRLESASGVLVGGVTDAGNAITADTGVKVVSTTPSAAVSRIIANVVDADGTGVDVGGDAESLQVGGATLEPGEAPGNRIEAGRVGVDVAGSKTTVAGNIIRQQGMVAGVGIFVREGADDTTIGGEQPSAGNRITGFGPAGTPPAGSGIYVLEKTVVAHNLVGVGADGRTAEPNGIGLTVAAGTGSLIADNVVSGNANLGVSVTDAAATVRGNRIGTDPTGTVAVPNGRGLLVEGGATVGGPHAGACESPCNLVSGNTGYGVQLSGDTAGITFAGNVVGAAADGITPLPNGHGVEAAGRATIGGTGTGDGNLIAFNRATGVWVAGTDSAVAIRGNRIHSNGALGIDLGGAGFGGEPDGVTPDDIVEGDDDSGPNGLTNFPVIQAVTSSGTGLQVSGDTLGGLASSTVELFLNRECDGSGNGEGELPAGTTSTSILSPEFSLLIDRVAGYRYLTATVTGSEGTSELSQCFDLLTAVGTPGRTSLTSSVPAGGMVLEVASTGGFLGKVVQVGTGATAEVSFVGAIGSLHLARPLRFAHAAGEPVVALDDTLFVSVDKAVITRSPRLPDLAVLSGRVQAAGGRSVACGEDVTLTLGGAAVAQKVPGTRFQRQRGNRCVFVSTTQNGIGRLELDLGKGTWTAQVVRGDLERLSNPVEIGLRIGDDAGAETLAFRASRAIWTYAR